jgi:hypothetical protein
MLVTRTLRNVFEDIYERDTFYIASDAGGAVASTKVISPAGLILAARLTGYQALRDQVRIKKVQVHLKPIASASTPGLGVLYIERDPAAAVVATPQLALDQFEVTSCQAWNALSLTWKPQQPSDRAFQNLNPGTTSLGSFYLLGTGFTVSAPIWNMTVKIWAVLRGRP